MALVQIPIRIDRANFEASQDFEMSLGGKRLLFQLRFNVRSQTWQLGIYDIDKNPIHTGIRIVSNYKLSKRISDERFSDGALWAINIAGNAEPTYETLGSDIILVFDDGN